MKAHALHFFLVTTTLLLCSAVPHGCHCTYGEECWPHIAQFAQLSSLVSQPLIHPVPPASACYPEFDSGDPACVVGQENQFNNTWLSQQPGSAQWPNYQTYTLPNGTINACYMNVTLGFPCTQGSVPVIGVDARSESDIQAAVSFAAQHNLRLVVKNTGHDYLGRSMGRGSFMIWTHHMKKIDYHTSFVPKGAPTSAEEYNIITVEAGVQWHEAYHTAQAHGRTLVGGVADGGSVGAAGGWLLGGGYSLLSPQYGLGVDNVIQITLVIANGKCLTVNSYLHADLFWALRGGGGGTYGVVTSATYRTHPSVPLIGAFFTANMTNPVMAKKFVTEFIRLTPSLSDAGWSGHGLITNRNTFKFVYIAPNVSSADANASINPFFLYAQSLASEGLVVLDAFTTGYSSFFDWYIDLYGTDRDGGHNTEIGSRFLPRDVFDEHEKVAEAFLLGQVNWILAGGAVSQVDPSSMGVNPAWRKAFVHAVVGTNWADGTSASRIDEARDNLKRRLANLTALAPDSGCYFNEASLYELNPHETFFGSHYDTLKAIKKNYDPDDLFLVAGGVGSDEWDWELRCRKFDETSESSSLLNEYPAEYRPLVQMRMQEQGVALYPESQVRLRTPVSSNSL